MKKNCVNVCVLFSLALVLVLAACPTDGGGNGNGVKKDLTYSIQVNNQAASPRAITASDTVELFITNFEYCEDAQNRAMILIANGDRDMGSKGGILNNAGWYSVDEVDLSVANDVNAGPYSSFQIKISKIKVNEVEYTVQRDRAFFGHPTSIWNGGVAQYPDNFSGVEISDSTVSLKTILTVNPDILDGDGNLEDDPYSFITVEGRVNE
jgi:hypothetical protein